MGRDLGRGSDAIQFGGKLALEYALTRLRLDKAKFRLQCAVFHREVGPPDHAVAPEQRQRVISELPFGSRRVGFESIHPSP